jgi:hypothetical protein
LTGSLPKPLAADAVTTFDPTTRSLLVKLSGVGAIFWRRGRAAMVAAEEAGRYTDRVYAHGPGRREIARGEAVVDNWVRFRLSEADYRQLAGEGLRAVAVVDQQTSNIMSVRFIGG